jgi:hypothetical protein
MVHLHGRLAVVALSTVVLVGACGKPEAPPPPKVEAVAAPTVNEEIKRRAMEVYVYALPLVLMDLARQVQTAKTPADTFQHRHASDATAGELVHPNPDVFYSEAWLDLAREPIVLSLPDTHGRYYALPMFDAWTNVFQSTGKRTTGTNKGDFAIVGPKWKGELPKDVDEIKAPTDLVWLLGRTETSRAEDATVAKLVEQYKLTPLSQWHKPGAKAHAPAAAHAGIDVKTPPAEQVAKMDARTFFTRFAELLPGNPPSKHDAHLVEVIQKLGIVAGQPFDPGKLDAAAAKGVEDGVKAAHEAIVAAAKGSIGDLRNGWTIHWDLGRYGTNYGLRAVIAWLDLGAIAPEDLIAPATHYDAGGHPLNGANKYVLHFDKGKAPPAQGFWSLAMYNDKQSFVPNSLDRHAIGDRDKLKFNADGSLDLYLQNEDPGRDQESNWLPAPKGNFDVILRIYWPKQEMLDRNWTPPGIKRVA